MGTRVGGGRKAPTKAEARAIRDRLQLYVRSNYKSRLAFERRLRVSHATVTAWFGTDPAIPDTVHLLTLARKENLSLDWLLLGEGGELRGTAVPSNDLGNSVRKWLVAKLVSEGTVSRDDAEKYLPEGSRLLHSLFVDRRERFIEFRGVRRGVLPLAKAMMRLRR